MNKIFERLKDYFKKDKIVSIFSIGVLLIICFSTLSFSISILAKEFPLDSFKMTFQESLKSYLEKITLKPIKTSEPEIDQLTEYVPQTTQEQAVLALLRIILRQ